MIDAYCERTSPGVWDEPLNLITNLGFVVAAAMALGLFRRQPDLRPENGWDLLLLVGLLFAIGIGSGLFHALANRWSLLADVIPIVLLINLYLLSALYRATSAPVWALPVWFAVYQLLSLGLGTLVPQDALNGSVGYLAPMLAMIPLWAWLNGRRHPMERSVWAAMLLFLLSLVFRTIDEAVCPTLQIGTHFLWHLLNAMVLYLLVGGLIRHGRRQPSRGGAATSNP